MRKYLAIVLGVLFILSFAVVASAQDKPEITLGGKILVRGWYFDNVNGILPEATESQAMYSTNANITIDAKVADNVKGFMELESNKESGSRTSGLYYWGSHDQKAPAELLFRQLWIQYTGSGLLGVPAGIKAGHMLLTLGEKQFLNHERFGDDAIFLTVEPTKELLIGLVTAKLVEGFNEAHSDDVDAYAILGTYKVDKDNTVGLNYTLIHSDALATGAYPPTPDVDSLNFQNLGLHANGKVSELSYAAEVDFQFGKANGLPGEDDAKFKGYGIFAKLGYMVDPVNLRASFAMGSGDNDFDDNDVKEFQALVGTPDDGSSATARFVHYTQIYERTVRTAAQDQALTDNTRTTGIANTTYYNLGMDYSPVKDLSLSLDGFLLRATKTSGLEDIVGDSVSKNVGWEIDAKITYKIAKNLTYFIEAGTFKPGKYYEDAFDIDKKTVNQAVHGLLLTF